jgi:hypothetical protein
VGPGFGTAWGGAEKREGALGATGGGGGQLGDRLQPPVGRGGRRGAGDPTRAQLTDGAGRRRGSVFSS